MCRREDSDDDIFSSNNDHRGNRSSRRRDGQGDGGELTREDMLAIPGSADSGSSIEDMVHSPFAAQKEAMIELQRSVASVTNDYCCICFEESLIASLLELVPCGHRCVCAESEIPYLERDTLSETTEALRTVVSDRVSRSEH